MIRTALAIKWDVIEEDVNRLMQSGMTFDAAVASLPVGKYLIVTEASATPGMTSIDPYAVAHEFPSSTYRMMRVIATHQHKPDAID